MVCQKSYRWELSFGTVVDSSILKTVKIMFYTRFSFEAQEGLELLKTGIDFRAGLNAKKKKNLSDKGALSQ